MPGAFRLHSGDELHNSGGPRPGTPKMINDGELSTRDLSTWQQTEGRRTPDLETASSSLRNCEGPPKVINRNMKFSDLRKSSAL